MIENLINNRFWFWKALETYGIGVMFIIRKNTISFYPPRPSLLMYFDDPPFIFLMGIVGKQSATNWDGLKIDANYSYNEMKKRRK